MNPSKSVKKNKLSGFWQLIGGLWQYHICKGVCDSVVLIEAL